MVTVYSKIELSEKIKKEVLSIVKERSGNNKLTVSDINFVIDNTIYSGIRIDVDSQVIDLTLNNRLEKVLEALH